MAKSDKTPTKTGKAKAKATEEKKAGGRPLDLNSEGTKDGEPPREASRRATALGLMKAKGGTTLEAIMKACDWTRVQAIGAVRLLSTKNGVAVKHNLDTGKISA